MLQYYFYSEYCYYYCLLITVLKTLVHEKIFDEIMIKHESNTTLKLFKINFNILTAINKYSYKMMISFDVILPNFISDIRLRSNYIHICETLHKNNSKLKSVCRKYCRYQN